MSAQSRDVSLQVRAPEDSFAANIWHIHLLSKCRRAPCVLDKITRRTARGGTAGVKKQPPVQAKGKGISLRRSGPGLVQVRRASRASGVPG